ncbi:SpoIIE family protein phosphatase [Sphaerospermopsis aphanizomenoides BCCUSP55]|uniref:SpoIIE family protein phosphatase n=1 Tax=Sphaerospermopsis aphanizomenoides TaxID=459663 RepID=UPI001906182A|nr:SpoIIE family protein phosphatase [Sphaerospermopsis aphanizomenoides]MBK1986085.1 SpoIIE family protein phosphatase [Sphaerospermopsis aphanizomenoides BCCUSP55]
MKNLSLFRFKSITQRLIFSCVAAAIAIYGVSYWQARQLMYKTVGTWLIDLSQSRIDTVANEIEGKLQAIERSILLSIHSVEKLATNSNSVNQNDLVPPLKNLLDQQPQLQAIALINPKNISAPGWYYNRQKKYTNLNQADTKNWLNRCQINSNKPANSPFWTEPYSFNNSSVITYCVPLLADSNSATMSWLAIEVNLDWVAATITEKLSYSNELRGIELGNSFIFSPSNKQWIVKPTNPQLVASWLSQQNNILNNNQKSRELINNRKNFQGLLMTKTVTSTDWIVGITFPAAKSEQLQQQYLWLVIVSMSKDMVLMCLVIAFICQLTIRPLRQLNTSTQEMAQGNLDTILPEVTSDDEVGRLTQSFRRMRDCLQLYIQNLQETTAAKQKLESELSIAAQIQRTMVPKTTVDSSCNSPYQISALLKPARIVGGDLYDFFLLGSDRLCVIIGDVADKGFPAALLMARTVTLIRTLTKPVYTPREILYTVNQELCADNEECLFVTVFCGVIDLNSGKFTYASGGHDAPLLMHNRQVQYLELETGPPLGLYEDSVFEQSECILTANDLILLYTDGITEAMNSQGEIFSETRLIEMMTSYPPSNPARAVRTIVHFCQQFVGDAPQSDDMTLLAVQYLPSGPFSQVANVMEWNLTINSELTELEAVKQKLGEILQAAELTVEVIEDAQLIVEEVLVNIIEYGYENNSDACIDLRIEMNEQQLKMTFKDSGKPFNPLTEIMPADTSMDDEERSQGGFGFFLVQQLAQQVDYAYLNGKNVLTVRQAIAQAA